jgi:hypothetical protein
MGPEHPYTLATRSHLAFWTGVAGMRPESTSRPARSATTCMWRCAWRHSGLPHRDEQAALLGKHSWPGKPPGRPSACAGDRPGFFCACAEPSPRATQPSAHDGRDGSADWVLMASARAGLRAGATSAATGAAFLSSSSRLLDGTSRAVSSAPRPSSAADTVNAMV